MSCLVDQFESMRANDLSGIILGMTLAKCVLIVPPEKPAARQAAMTNNCFIVPLNYHFAVFALQPWACGFSGSTSAISAEP